MGLYFHNKVSYGYKYEYEYISGNIFYRLDLFSY